MKTMALAVAVAVMTLVVSASAFAQKNDEANKAVAQVYEDLNRLAASVGDLREELCPKQSSPQLCRIEFGTLTLIVTNIGATLANARMAAVTGNEAGYQNAMSKVMDDLDRFSQKFEGLVKKYKVD